MEFRFASVAIVLVVSIYFVHSAVAMPRTPENLDEVIPLDQSIGEVKLEKVTVKPPAADAKMPGRIKCQFEEATEESTCQEHCLPKGYTYGLCINYTCSCI